MSTRGKSSSRKTPFFKRIDRRWPWLKLVAVMVVGMVALFDLLDLTISGVKDPSVRRMVAPMQTHVKVPERSIIGKKLVALTVDDGPSGLTTPALLDVLKARDVPATFFMLGIMARRNPEVARRIFDEGHEVASHTMSHQNLVKIKPAAVEADINEMNAVFLEVLGEKPNLTRPPYGNFNENVREIIKTPLILWSVDTMDWKNRNPEAIVATALSQVYDGGIILMHDVYQESVEAVPELIDALRREGYEFVTVSELAKNRGVSLVSGKAYYSLKP